MSLDTIVIGGGLFGRVVAKHLTRLGQDVLVVDANREHAGSKPAACLMKPSWFSSLGKDVYEPSLELLNDLYGVQDLSFKVGPVKMDGVHWIPPGSILDDKEYRVIHDEIVNVEPGVVRNAHGYRHEAKTVVVAAGAWTSQLVNVPGLTGRAGAAFLWPGITLTEPFISPWAPYRQLVAFNRGDGMWVGDGTAIKPENWSMDREAQSRDRCARAVQNPAKAPKTLYGVRPYVPKAKPAFLMLARGLCVATGGAKNGTLAAGWCAKQIGDFLS